MVIVYNPKDGAPIKNFICKGILIDPHYPDGAEMPNGKRSNGLVQYEDQVAYEILETYQFLQQKNTQEAEELLKRPEEPEYKCDFPGCEFATTTKVALIGHNKKHTKDRSEQIKPLIDPTLIPVAGGRKLPTIAQGDDLRDNKDIPNGPDGDGVSWYGEGVKIERPTGSFGGERVPGQGRFKG